MEDKKISQDLDEDEELASLRLAALATLKSRISQNTEPIIEKGNNILPIIEKGNNILPISSISRNVTHSSDHGSRNNQHSWRNNTQLLKRKGKAFPKSSQRSNLIVITPVGVEKKKASLESNSAPQLLLPQHKWCQQVNEDSSSPRTDRHTGPSRFNRHGSESESSDSEYEDSDDSYSNETVLQDEPSRLSPLLSSNDSRDNINSERKLSFKNLDTDLNLEGVDRNESNSVYNCVRTSFSSSHTENNDPNQKEAEDSFSTPQSKSLNSNNYGTEDKLFTKSSITDDSETVLSASADISKQKSKHTPIKFDMPNSVNDKNKTNLDNDKNEKYIESLNGLTEKSKGYKVDGSGAVEPKISLLSKNDLRFEIKRKKANMIALNSVSSKISNKDQIRHEKNRVRKLYPRRSRDRSKSQDRGNYTRSRSRTPDKRGRHHNRRRASSSRSRSSSFSSSSSSSVTSSDSSPKTSRSISSVVKPVSTKVNTEMHSTIQTANNKNSFQLSFNKEELPLKKAKSIEIKLMPVSNFKISVSGNDSRNIAPDLKRRGPVHMRLGALPQKRVIQMPKDVEAAFVSTSSDDEDVNNKCKKPNCMVVTDICDKKTDGLISRSRKKANLRSDVPKVGKGKVLR